MRTGCPRAPTKPKRTPKSALHASTRLDALIRIDEKYAHEREIHYQAVELKEFCDNFRNFAASKLNLFYDISIIREFVSGLAVSKFLILQGMSGTGKTSLAYAFGEFLGSPSEIIPVQPMWKERSDLIGYYNEFTRRYNETPLLQTMYEAGKSEEMFFALLDEMNIARVEYYFAEFLSLMEIPDARSRKIGIVSGEMSGDPIDLIDGCVLLPENLWFLGTANNDDSTFAISDKVYDRAMVVDLEQRALPFEGESVEPMHITKAEFERAALSAKQVGIGKGSEEKLIKLDAYLSEKFKMSFGNRIMRQIREYVPVYVACGGTEEDALDDIVAKKVLRKLEAFNLAYRRDDAEKLCRFIGETFGQKAIRCVSYIRSMARID